ncbi:hypothetical protein GQR58_025662 [Nymphon striatum]|nr:hypothetical protein GQR58_025662 [Nymphon striatum]
MTSIETSHPWLADQFNDGKHDVCRSERSWGGLRSNLIIEQTMMLSVNTRSRGNKRSWQDSVKASVMFIIDPLVGPLGHNKLESSQAKKKNKLLRGGERKEEKFQQFNEIRDREVWKLDVKEIQDGC